jgi:hypothetical protein
VPKPGPHPCSVTGRVPDEAEILDKLALDDLKKKKLSPPTGGFRG